MKFLVDKFPGYGWECPFFSLGWCHSRVPSSGTGEHKCPIFHENGYRYNDMEKEDCHMLTEVVKQER